MLIIISPAKTFSKEAYLPEIAYTSPRQLEASGKLMGKLRSLNRKQFANLMNLSNELANLNRERHENWQPPFTTRNSDAAIFAFIGEVYRGLDARSLSNDELMYAQDHLRILSGLYGCLRPLDLIQPYRLEMGAKLKYYRKNNLYQFWGDDITRLINEDMDDSGVLINLASNEYFKSINTKKLTARIITPQFKDFSNGQYKSLMTYAKHARGMMSRYIIKQRIEDPELLKGFNEGGYIFNPGMSSGDELVFTRG